jgi:hypothetical protein
VTTYRDEDGNVFTEERMRNQWSEDIAFMDPEKVDQDDQHSYRGWLGDMLIWGRYSEIDEDED